MAILIQTDVPTIHLRPAIRPVFFGELFVNLAGCQPKKAHWIHHRFADHALGFVASGKGAYQVDDGAVQKIGPGSLFAVYPGPVFHYGPDEKSTWEEYHFGFGGPGLTQWIERGLFPIDGRVRQLSNIALLVESFRELLRVMGRAGLGDADRGVAIAQRLLLELHFSGSCVQQASTPSEGLQRIIEYCQQHYASAIDFEQLAARQHMSYSSLRQSLRRIAGVAPAHYLMRLRCQAAQQLLCEGKLSIKEIGARVGIPDPYSFSRAFKRSTGVSPRAFRQRLAPWSGAQQAN